MTDIVKKPAKTAKKASSTALTASLSPDGSLSRYLREIRKFPMLEAQQEYMLAKSYADHQDTDAAHQLVTSHLRLVAKIAMGYRGYGLPLGEVIQEGNVGLMQAVKKFDAERGFRLATYAMWWIRASIQEYILRSWSLVKIGTTGAQKKLFFNLRKIKGQIDAIDGGQLTPEQVTEISDRLNVSPEDVEQMDGRMSGSDRSLNAPISHGEDDSGEWQDWLEDDREDPEAALVVSDEMDVRREMMQQAMSVLNEREIDILTARRLSEPAATLEELSQKHDVSRERIRQIETRAFEKLRDAMVADNASQNNGVIEGEVLG
ncbi:MAG TPA: RNA polymerase factor sigma-32 [Rhodobiaceae bacterium]|nr:RNA polymerase factor sigma-32 [Rhodobiaceae bacterium]|tara:strand:+ start:213 stop:1166 length:954 start_codon:yes stop_codon:yes gene_type:complete